jgi:aerobic-type carbon monoxide dehydrogenase small subunit (CoxS/CutS family)
VAGKIAITVDGRVTEVSVDPEMPLIYVLMN